MKITTIKYTEEFNYHGASQWIGLGAEIIEGEDIKKNLYELQRQARGFFYESSAVAEKQVPEVQQEKHSLTKVADLIKQINSCKELKGEHGLEGYKLIAKGDADLENAYNQMSIKLNLKEETNGRN